MPHTATGQAGQLLVGGRSVARLGRWTYDREGTLDGVFEDDKWSVHADLLHAEEFWLRRKGTQLELRLQVSKRFWSFYDVDANWDKNKIYLRGSGKPVVK